MIKYAKILKAVLLTKRRGSFDPSILSTRLPGQVVTATPAAPAGTASLVGVMMGLAVAVTPRATGRVRIFISGNLAQNTTADGASPQISHGTGAAPANGAALAGTQDGVAQTMTFLTGVLSVPFTLEVVISGLVVGVAAWVDLALKAVTGGSASVSNLYVSVTEF